MAVREIFDVAIVGAGAVGSAIAREMSAYRLKIAVLEKEYDVAAGTSGRNSAVVHAGFNNTPGSLMARFCVEGNRGFEALCADLGVTYRKTGKVLVAFTPEDEEVLRGLVKKGEANGCRGLRLLNKAQLSARVPGVGGISGMESCDTAVFDPFLYTVALAENAAGNGAKFFFGWELTKVTWEDGIFCLESPGGKLYSRVLVNSAGLYADRVSALAGVEGYKLYPCRGEYLIFESDPALLDVPVYPAPRSGIGGLGVHLTVTTEGDILVGPSAEYISSEADTASTGEVQARLRREAEELLPALRSRTPIGAYCGIRAKQAPPRLGGFFDFTIKSEPAVPGLINLIGIESPGLTASVPIAKYVRELVSELIPLEENPEFNPKRTPPPRFRDLTEAEQAALIARDPNWGEIVCRCRKITRAEIIAAAKNPLGVHTVAGIKYRTRATTGRCQGGYCFAKIADILMEELNLEPEEIVYRDPEGKFFR